MSNIFQISQKFQAIIDELEENGGELTPELEEQLNITQDDFKLKIKSYSQTIANLETDILAIKSEKDRLTALQKAKEGTITRLKRIMALAIDRFGDSTKSGGKFVDYGTGKVSVKNTTSVEVAEDDVNKFVNKYISAINWYSRHNQLDRSLVNVNDLIEYANSENNEEDSENSTLSFSEDDLNFINTKVEFSIPINDLLSTDNGFLIIKSLLNYGGAKFKASVDKNEIKKSDKTPIYASIINNKTVTIK